MGYGWKPTAMPSKMAQQRFCYYRKSEELYDLFVVFLILFD